MLRMYSIILSRTIITFIGVFELNQELKEKYINYRFHKVLFKW